MKGASNNVGAKVLAATPYRPLLWVSVAAGLGIAADYYLQFVSDRGIFGWWWIGAVAALGSAVIARRYWRLNLATACLLLAAGAIGGAWHDWRWNYVEFHELARFATEEAQPACVEAIVADRVKISPPADRSPLRALPAQTMSEATIRILAIRDGQLWRPAAGLSRLRVTGEVRELAAGDRVQVFAQLARPPAPLNPGEFDWSAVERRAGRLSELYCVDPRCITVKQPAGGVTLATPVASIRKWCEKQLAANVDPARAPLVLATLLGDQERLSDSTKDAFLKTGAIHLLVVSGAHTALLATMAWQIFRGASLSRSVQVYATGAIVVLYAAIVGPQPSVMRATILTLATIGALLRGRVASAGNLLGAAALAVMLFNPCELFRAGTQFSFLAVAVLIAFSKWNVRRSAPTPLERLLEESQTWPERIVRRIARYWVAMTAASMAVGIALAPLVAHHFNVVTPASILLTPIAGPLIGVALAAGAGVLTLGWLVPPMGALLGAICGGCLHWTEAMVVFAEGVPGSYFYTPGLPAWWLWVFYGAAGLLLAIPRLRPQWHWQMSSAMLWLAVGYSSIGFGRTAPEELRTTFLSMGHGTCVVMELPSGQTVLYDAGSLGSPDLAAKTIASFLWSRGIERIDALILSHADIDHYNAVPGLVERFPIGVVYISPMMFDPIATNGQLTAPNYLRDVLTAADVPMREVWMGDRLRTSDADVAIEVLHPPREGVIGRDNANSLMLSVDFACRRMLLPGDLESPGIERVISDPPLDCDILLAPHHGSELSDPPGFAAWCTPEWVVMSGRRPDRTLLAHHSYQQSGAQVLHTAADGAITFTLSTNGEELTTHCGTP